jgi:serine/threonine protein kinase
LPTTNTILIIDFGEAFFIDNPPARGLHTPYPFRAPECAFLQEKSPSSDMWAVGCLLYLWFNGLNLFGEDSLKRIIPLWIRELGPLPDKYSSRIAEIIDIKEPMKDNYGKVVDSSRPQLRDTIVEGFNWVNFHSTRPTTLSREQLIDKTHGIFPRTMPPLPTYVCTSSAASTSESLEQTQLSFAVRSCTCNSTSRAPSPSPPPPHNDLTSTLQRQLSSQATHSKDADLDDLDPLIASFPDLMAQLLDYDPRKRIPAIAMLEHRWLKSDMGGVMPWGVKLVPVADEEEKESGIRAWVYFRVG